MPKTYSYHKGDRQAPIPYKKVAEILALHFGTDVTVYDPALCVGFVNTESLALGGKPEWISESGA